MTKVGDVTIDTPVTYNRRGYNAILEGSFDDSLGFNELREMWAKADFGSAIHEVPGERPYGEDLTEDSQNTQYIIFTHGTSGKPQNGYYLLRASHNFVEDRSPEGHSYVFAVALFFLGTTAIYQDGYLLTEQEDVTNNWGI